MLPFAAPPMRLEVNSTEVIASVDLYQNASVPTCRSSDAVAGQLNDVKFTIPVFQLVDLALATIPHAISGALELNTPLEPKLEPTTA